ncbi:galectin-12 isoform X1 [Pleurodeles waltl]|uniref:galectin-12 isoform X1 n=1 Tax=Pleurodeles waltl TaxID=8319 RepID=UPI0037099E92
METIPASFLLQPPVFHPVLPYITTIFGGVYHGKQILVHGTVHGEAERFQVDFQCGCSVRPRADIAFHFNPRFNSSPYVICNTLEGERWQDEKKFPKLPLKGGDNFEFIFRFEKNCVKNITEEREPLEGSAPKVNTVNFFCLCCSRQSESITSQNKEPRKKCVCTYTSHDLEKEAPGVPCDTIWPVKGFAAAVVNACVKRDYYDLCYGHKINDPQQEAHECLYDAYTARTIRHVCNRIDTYRVYKLLRVVYGLSAVKKSVHCDMMKVLAAAVLEIRYAAEPCSKLDRMHGLCPPFDKRMVERVIERRMCDIYYKNRRMLSLAPRKLF